MNNMVNCNLQGKKSTAHNATVTEQWFRLVLPFDNFNINLVPPMFLVVFKLNSSGLFENSKYRKKIHACFYNTAFCY